MRLERNIRTVVVRLLAVGVASAFASLCAADTTVSTGLSWEISRNDGGGWVAPDTSQDNFPLPDGSTATAIFWGNDFNAADTWYREFFNLGALDFPLEAKAHFQTGANDQVFELLVNGNAVDLGAVQTPNSPAAGLSIPSTHFLLGENEVLFKTDVSAAGGSRLAAKIELTTVPEPSFAMLGGSGMLLLTVRRRLSPK